MNDKKRYTVIDVLRGFSILSMIAYHTVWDLVYIYNVDINWYRSRCSDIWQASIYITFIVISGFCWSMGKKRLKRGLTVFICSWVISAVTAVFMSENLILFGVLFLIGSAMLILIPLNSVFEKVHPILGVILSLAVFIIVKDINHGTIGIGGLKIPISKTLYANVFTSALGFPNGDFVSMDYFPLLPWLFMYFVGYFLYKIFEKYGWLELLSLLSFEPLEFIGRHTILIYMVHQPVVYGVLFVIFNIL